MDRSFFLFVTIHVFVRQTDRRTNGRTDILIAEPRVHSMQRGKKINENNSMLSKFKRYYLLDVVISLDL